MLQTAGIIGQYIARRLGRIARLSLVVPERMRGILLAVLEKHFVLSSLEFLFVAMAVGFSMAMGG